MMMGLIFHTSPDLMVEKENYMTYMTQKHSNSCLAVLDYYQSAKCALERDMGKGDGKGVICLEIIFRISKIQMEIYICLQKGCWGKLTCQFPRWLEFYQLNADALTRGNFTRWQWALPGKLLSWMFTRQIPSSHEASSIRLTQPPS